MRLSDQIFLNGIKGEALAFVNEAEWQLVEKAVSDAGSVLNTQGMARTIIEKASFGGNRSEAGRYAANMRWKGQGNSNNSPSDPSDKMATRLRSIAEGDLSDIASIIRRDFAEQGKKIPPAAQPYLDALSTLGTVDDAYGMDSGKSIVAYTLSNLTSYKGETARAVKAELKARLKGKKQSETNEDPNAPSDADMAGMTEEEYQLDEIKVLLYEAQGDLEVEYDLHGRNTEMARNTRTRISNYKRELSGTNDSPNAPRASKNESSGGVRIVPSKMHSDDIESLAEVTDPEERKKKIDGLIEFYGTRIYAKPSKPRRSEVITTQTVG